MQAEVRETQNLSVIEAEVDDLIVRDGVVAGVKLVDGREIAAGAVWAHHRYVFVGPHPYRRAANPRGRAGELPALGLSRTLARFEFALGRLKTGTPPSP